jgi:GntR family transcriptional repressor for pyruvate dehydrogenase complex
LVNIEPIQRRGRISDQVAGYLKRLIATGQLKVGDRLPAERDLAEHLEVSRNSVREALHALELTGLIESRQGGGNYVRQADMDSIREPLSSVLITREGVIAEILDARRLMEPPLARRAAENATEDQMAGMAKILAQQESAVKDGKSGSDEDTRFHHALAEATGNTVMVKMVEAMSEVLYASRERDLQPTDRSHASIRGHRKVLDAITRRDAEGAYKAMLEHLGDVEHVITEGGS